MNEVRRINHDIKLQRVVINRFGIGDVYNTYLVMYPISKELENEIDVAIKIGNNNIDIELENGVPIKLSDIQAYGELNLFSCDDYDKLESLMKRTNHYEPIRIPKKFNYDSNESESTIDGIMYRESFNFEKAFEYYHAIIGKPDRILIVKMNGKFLKQSSRFK